MTNQEWPTESLYFDRNGNSITAQQWAELMGLPSYRYIAKTHDMKLHGRRVSTIWLGLNHGVDKHTLIFETAVFSQDGSVLDMRRVSTEEEAKIAHAEMCAKWELEDSLAREIYDEL